ncbi:MAG: hypothetical protein PSX37_03570 [bacterium]|nr:hypothetical protein [bacterium]
MRTLTRPIALSAVALALAATALTGCSKDDTTPVPSPTTSVMTGENMVDPSSDAMMSESPDAMMSESSDSMMSESPDAMMDESPSS